MATIPRNVTNNFAPAIQVGASEAAVRASSEAIMLILNAPHCDEETKRLALSVLEKACSTGPLTISECNFQTGK